MLDTELQKEITRIENLLTENANAYYKGQECMSDDAFDHYAERLRSICPDSPVLQGTGWGVKVLKGKQAHQYGTVEGIPDKIRPNELVKRMNTLGITPQSNYIISAKLDGASVLLYYKNGGLVNAITRGDGVYGEGILDKMRYIAPQKISQSFTGSVRGEFLISKENHAKYYPDAKSTRNTASGLLLRDSVSVEELSLFSLVCYNVRGEALDLPFLEQYDFLESNGFTCAPYIDSRSITYDRISSIESCAALLLDLNKRVYDCDGLVISHAKGLTAVKWNTEGTETKVKDIVWEGSRLGKFTPVVYIEPVDLSGATIRKVTGFNYQFLIDNCVGIGSSIRVVRSGDVIPYITEVCTPSSQNKVPNKCPFCSGALTVEGVNLTCTNKDCEMRGVKTLLHFVHQVADVDGLGDVMLKEFFNKFKINTIEKFLAFCGTYVDFEILRFCNMTNGMGNAAYKKFISLLEGYKKPLDLSTVIMGLGLPNLGDKTIKKVLNTYNYEDIGPAIEDGRFTVDGINYLALAELTESWGQVQKIVSLLPCAPFYTKQKKDIIYSKKVCVTGPLSVPRREFLDMCLSYGIEESAINKADFLVTNTPDSGTTKNVKARELGIPVLTEMEFRQTYINQ